MFSLFNKELSSIRRRRLAEGTAGAGSNIEEPLTSYLEPTPEPVNPSLSGMWNDFTLQLQDCRFSNFLISRTTITL